MSDDVQKIEIVDDKRSGLGTASMVLGIIAIIGSWIPFLNIFSIILAVIGLGLGIPAFIILLAKKKGSMGKTLAGLILCILTLVIAINMNNATTEVVNDGINELNNSIEEMSGSKTEEILANDVEITFGNYTTDGNQYYETGKLEVTVKNKNAKSLTYTIKIEALDADGVRIATDTVYANSIGSGQTAKFDAFTLASVSKLKNAKSFNVYEISKY